MKIRNLVIYPSSRHSLSDLHEEYQFIGRESKIEVTASGPRLVVFALPQTRKKGKKRRAPQRFNNEDNSDN